MPKLAERGASASVVRYTGRWKVSRRRIQNKIPLAAQIRYSGGSAIGYSSSSQKAGDSGSAFQFAFAFQLNPSPDNKDR